MLNWLPAELPTCAALAGAAGPELAASGPAQLLRPALRLRERPGLNHCVQMGLNHPGGSGGGGAWAGFGAASAASATPAPRSRSAAAGAAQPASFWEMTEQQKHFGWL